MGWAFLAVAWVGVLVSQLIIPSQNGGGGQVNNHLDTVRIMEVGNLHMAILKEGKMLNCVTRSLNQIEIEKISLKVSMVVQYGYETEYQNKYANNGDPFARHYQYILFCGRQLTLLNTGIYCLKDQVFIIESQGTVNLQDRQVGTSVWKNDHFSTPIMKLDDKRVFYLLTSDIEDVKDIFNQIQLPRKWNRKNDDWNPAPAR